MAISPQLLTIYLYSAHRAVIFAIAQLSCVHFGMVAALTSAVKVHGTVHSIVIFVPSVWLKHLLLNAKFRVPLILAVRAMKLCWRP